MRGLPVDSNLAPLVVATIHPSAILRVDDGELREREFERFVGDLRVVTGDMATDRP
jgi:hypothetical protein